MLYTTDSLKNALRAHRPYRSLMEDSGIEISELGMTSNPTKNPESLKLLAYSRAHSRQVFTTCNLTISNVTPKQIPARNATQLTFTTAIRDCDIQTIRIGDNYVCTLGTVQTSTFTCTTQAIPIPGNYPIYLLFTTETTFRDTGSRITVTPVQSQDGSTTALTSLMVYREQGLFNSNELLGLLAAIIPIPTSAFSMLSDAVSGGNNQLKRSGNDTILELHTSVISITSVNPSAADAFNLIYNVLRVNPSVILPYRFSDFLLNGVCTASGACSCGPNFVGVGCTTPARCPNDCSGNGNCTSGPSGKVCNCNAGWTGSDCSIALCANNCNGHGSCNVALIGGNATCACDAGWLGLACEVPNCPNNCSGNACVNGTCICPTGITTPDCVDLSGDQTTGDKIVIDAGDKPDNYDRNVFIGVAVGFTALCGSALGALYYVQKTKQAANLMEG